MNSISEFCLFVNQSRFATPVYIVSSQSGLGLEIPAPESLSFFRLPQTVSGIGAELQTLAAFFALPEIRARNESFRSLQKLASNAGLPLRTIKRHLASLEKRGFILNRNRRGRRTATRCLDVAVWQAFKELPYYPLPRFAVALALTWSELIVLAYFANGRILNIHQAERNLAIQRKYISRAVAKLLRFGLLKMDSPSEVSSPLMAIRP